MGIRFQTSQEKNGIRVGELYYLLALWKMRVKQCKVLLLNVVIKLCSSSKYVCLPHEGDLV